VKAQGSARFEAEEVFIGDKEGRPLILIMNQAECFRQSSGTPTRGSQPVISRNVSVNRDRVSTAQ